MDTANKIKQISGKDTFFFKNVFLYLMLGMITIMTIAAYRSNFFPAIFLSSIFFLLMLYGVIRSFWVRIADTVLLDYEKKVIVFIYKKRQIRIEKRFEDFQDIKRRRTFIQITFKDKERHSFYLQNLGSFFDDDRDVIYNELNDILKYSLLIR